MCMCHHHSGPPRVAVQPSNCAVSLSTSSVLAASMLLIVSESLVQVTVVGGPPDELQVRMNLMSALRVNGVSHNVTY